MTHLSVKALRHYHEIGLLVPAEVDASTSYRLYGTDQVRPAQVIRRLRDLGMSLEDIKRVLSAQDIASRNRAILEHLQRMEADLAQARASVDSLRRLLDAPERKDALIGFRSLRKTPSLAIKEVVATADLESWWEEAFEELRSAAQRAGLERAGPDGALYPGDLFEVESAEVVAFVPFVRAPDAPRSSRVHPYVVPAAELAVLLHEGPFSDLDQTYGALGTFVSDRAISIDEPIREYYLVTSFDTADERKHRIEVAWPIFQTSES